MIISTSQKIFSLLLLTFLSPGKCDSGESGLNLGQVELAKGKLQGIKLSSRKGRKYFGYLGIPYGKIPQRFDVPQPADGWTGTKDATILPPPCLQFFTFTQQIIGVEDCLHLNVYSPATEEGKNLPVMVFFFPGGFQIGGASMFEAKYMMDEDVVYVSLNYRLGALGFLNTGDDIVSGNMGLKDQVLALKWVKENIKKFGGDPSSVTIFGVSAGGASVEYHTLSPMSSGLFHHAISQSGSVLAPWAFQNNPAKIAEELVKHAECFGDSWTEKVKCLREKEPSAIVNAQLKLMKLGIDIDFISMKFVPSVEADVAKSPKFLADSPYNLLKKGKIANKVPWISGHTENEGSYYIASMMIKEKIVTKINKEWNDIAPYMFYYDDLVPKSKWSSVSKQIWDFYFAKDAQLSTETKRNFANIYSDRFFTNSIAKSIQLHSAAKHEPIYTYILDYKGQHALSQYNFEGVTANDGVGHADDLMYLFNQTVGSPSMKLGTKDGDFSQKIIKIWVSFAKNGRPTGSKWSAISAQNKLKFLKLDLDSSEYLEDPLAKRREFWEQLKIQEHAKADLIEGKEEL